MSSERQALEQKSPWWGEHLHRYHEAAKTVLRTDCLLDLACGTGFGTNILAEHTEGMVIGGDVDPSAIEECREHWNLANLEFRVQDGVAIVFEDAFFDKLVSFETIEHTARYREMLAEFNRVLKPGGTAFISTPNFSINSPSGVLTNPYHTQEFEYDELLGLLSKAFDRVRILGQQYKRYRYNRGLNYSLARVAERSMYVRGVRKLPMRLQDKVISMLIDKPMYPWSEDYEMTTTEEEILTCRTFFAICEKR